MTLLGYYEAILNSLTRGIVKRDEEAKTPIVLESLPLIRVDDLHVRKSVPSLVLEGTEAGARKLTVKEDSGRLVVRNETDGLDELTLDPATLLKTIRDVQISKDVPKLRLTGTEAGGADLSIRENAGKIELYDEVAGALASLWPLIQDVQINKGTPALNLLGTETGAIDLTLKEDAGTFKITDNTNAVDLLKLNANQPVVIEIPVPVIFEVAQTGLDATTTGVKFTSQNIIPPVGNYLSVAIEATWTASATDSVTAIELYDETAAAVIASVSGNAGTNVKSSYVSVTPGNSLVVRVTVVTASAVTGATTDCTKAILYFRYTLS